MIHTFGCSFTKWHWPTWADWLGQYTGQSLNNLAHPGFSNDLIFQQILHHIDDFNPQDSIYIMWTGSNRVCSWYDLEFVETHDCRGFFPDPKGKLWYGNKPWMGLYKTHPKWLPSLTHMIVGLFDTVFKTQMLLDRVDCDYHMMFWQNPWHDVREKFEPQYSTTWLDKHDFADKEREHVNAIMALSPVESLLDAIDWQRFLPVPPELTKADTYHGLWEYTLSSKELVLSAHANDPHPSTLAHHDWAANIILANNGELRSKAKSLADQWQQKPVPVHDRAEEIANLR